MYRGINRSSLPAGGGAEDAQARCHGANKYAPIDWRVREKKEKKKKRKKGGRAPTSVDRPERVARAAHTGQ